MQKIKFILAFFLLFNAVFVVRYLSTNSASTQRNLAESSSKQKFCTDKGIEWDGPYEDYTPSKYEKSKSRVTNGVKMYRSSNKLIAEVKKDTVKFEDLETYFTDLVIIAIPFALFFLVSIIMWIVLCCCVCCHSKKNPKYSEQQKKIYAAISMVFQLAIFSSAIAGLALTGGFKDGINYLNCSLVAIVSDLLSGVGASSTHEWVGLVSWVDSVKALGDMSVYKADFEAISLSNAQEIQQNSADSFTLIQDQTSLAYTKINSTQLKLGASFQVISDQGVQLVSSNHNFDEDLGDINNLTSDLNKLDEDLVKLADDIDSIIAGNFQLVFNIVWGFILALSIIGIISIIFMFLNKKKVRIALNISWCCFCFLMIIGFLLCTIFLPVNIFFYEGCGVLEDMLQVDATHFKSYPGLVKDDISDKVETCLFGNGDLSQTLFENNQDFKNLQESVNALKEVEEIDESETINVLKSFTSKGWYSQVLDLTQQSNALIAIEKPKVKTINDKMSSNIFNLTKINCLFLSDDTKKLIDSLCTVFLVPIFETFTVLACASFFMFFAAIFCYKYSIMTGTKDMKTKNEI